MELRQCLHVQKTTPLRKGTRLPAVKAPLRQDHSAPKAQVSSPTDPGMIGRFTKVGFPSASISPAKHDSIKCVVIEASRV